MSERADATETAFWADSGGETAALERYRTLVNAVDDGIYQLDSAGRFVAVNTVIVEMTGYARDELLGEHVSIVLEDDDIDRLERGISESFANDDNPNETVEVTVRTATGERLDCELRMSLLVEDGTLQGTVGIVRYVTDRKRTEEMLDEREQQLERERDLTERILETSPVGIQVHSYDGEITRMNDRARDLLAVPESVEDYVPSDRAVYDGDGRLLPAAEHPFARTLETGEPVYDRVLRVELPDGGHRWLSANAAPIRTDDGEIDRVVTTGEDITELKERERRLERRADELSGELEEVYGRITDGFVALNEEWEFTHVNDRAEEILGAPRSDLLGTTIWEAFPDMIDSLFEDRYREAMATQETRTIEEYYPALDTWFKEFIYPSETGLSVYFRDVTEQKERERELTKYETIVETIDDGIYVKDANGRFTLVNDAYAELTGYDREELLGEHASLVVDEAAIEQSREKLTGTVDAETHDPAVEAEILTADGDRVPAEGTFATLQTADDRREEVGVVRDITTRKARERKLRESERRYRTFAEYFPNGLVTLFDHNLEYTLAAGRGFDRIPVEPDDLEGRPFHDVWPDETVAELKPAFHAALNGEEASIELEYAGREWVFHALPITDERGDVFAGMTMAQDITEQKKRERYLEDAKAQLEASNERLEHFAYAASHDLQEPLRMVSSYLQLIERRYSDVLDTEGEEFLEFAIDGADRMRDMIDGLLTYSRIETQGDPFEPIELATVFEDCLEDLQLQIEESDADIAAEELPRVRGDASQLRQLFQNLLSNAIEYSGDEPPRIRLDAERRGREWAISVHDEGIGIDSEDQERIFEVFQRLHSRGEHSGTGIGLALCQRIVERHGGEIWVDSEPGAGSTFSFTLAAATNE